MLIRNYWPNPRAMQSGRQPTQILDGTITWRWGDANGICLQPNTGANMGPYMMWELTGLPAGTPMILYAQIGGGTQGTLRGPLMEISTPTDRTIAVMAAGYPTQRENQLTFTTPSDGHVRAKFRGSDTQVTVFYDLCLTTATDHRTMQSLSLAQFDGDLMPLA